MKTNLIEVSKEQWKRIPKDYKGKWEDNGFGNIPEEFIGRRTVLSGCIGEPQGNLLTEGIHFIIKD